MYQIRYGELPFSGCSDLYPIIFDPALPEAVMLCLNTKIPPLFFFFFKMNYNQPEEVMTKLFKEKPVNGRLAIDAFAPIVESSETPSSDGEPTDFDVKVATPAHLNCVGEHWFEEEDFPVGKDDVHSKHPKDLIRETRRRVRQQKKRRARARRDFKPHGGEETKFNFARLRARTQDLRAYAASSHTQEEALELATKILAWKDLIPSAPKKSTHGSVINAIVASVSFVNALCSCDTYEQTRNVTMAVIGQYFDYDRILQVLDYVYSSTMHAQSAGDSFSDMYKKLEAMTLSVSDAPCGKFVFNVFSVLVMQGFSLGRHIENDSIKQFLSKIETDIYARSGVLNYMECIFSIIEYVAGLGDALRRGESLTQYVFPECLHTEVIEALTQVRELMLGSDTRNVSDELDLMLVKLEGLAARLKNVLRARRIPAKTYVAYDRYYERVLACKNEVELYRKNTSFRKAPVCYMFYGDSQIGKSHLYAAVENAVGVANGVRYNDAQIASLPELAKYHDVITNSTKVIRMDDVGCVDRTRSDPSESAIATLVGVVQNVTTWTNQSQADKKNAIPFRPDLVIGSSNSQDLGILDVFQHPAAAFNRVNIFHVKLLKKYRKENGQLDKEAAKRDSVDNIPPVMHTFQRITWKPVEGDATGQEYSPVTSTDVLDTSQFIEQVTRETRAHVQHQETLHANHVSQVRVKLCNSCGNPKNGRWCHCGGDVFVPDALIKFKAESLLEGFVFEAADNLALDVLHFTTGVFGDIVSTRAFRFFQNNALYAVLWALRLFLLSFWRMEYMFLRSISLVCAIVVFFLAFCAFSYPFACVTLLLVSIFFVYLALLGYGQAVKTTFKNDVTRSILQHTSRSVLTSSVAVISILSTGRLIYKMLMSRGNYGSDAAMSFITPLSSNIQETRPRACTIREEGNLAPKNMADVEVRRKEVSDWAEASTRPINVDRRLTTMTAAQAGNVVGKSLYKIALPAGEKDIVCFATFIEDNLAIIPKHVWQRVDECNPRVVFSKSRGVTFSAHVNHAFIPSGDHDVCFIQVTKSPSMASLSHMFYDERYTGLVDFVSRERGTLELTRASTYVERGNIPSSSGVLPARGLRYTLTVPSREGDCGSVLIGVSGSPRIIGFHCGGDSGHCAGTIVTKRMYCEYVEHLRHIMLKPEGECALPFAEGDSIDSAPYDMQRLELGTVDERHCVTHYPRMIENGVTCLGYSTALRASAFTSIEKSPLYTALERVGMPIEYGVPSMNSDRDHAEAFSHRMDPMQSINPELMRHSINDYTGGILDNMRKLEWPKSQPSSLDVVMNGKPGNRFYGPLNVDTSCGFGVQGKKTVLLDVSYSDEDGRKILTATPKFVKRYLEAYTRVRAGQRLNAITRTCVKDEPVKVGVDGTPKKRNRIFSTRPLDDLCVTKSLFLPVAEVLSAMPFISECAAGINVTRDDWGQLHGFLTEWNETNVMEGDYSKWDTRLSGQVIRAAGLCMIHVARELGYCEMDIVAMNCVISDIATSVVAYNGAVCIFDGWMPSGTFLTLLLNSVANSLIYRCAFYSRGFEGVNVLVHAPFREHNRLITMGDDSLCVNKSGNFSQLDMADFCGSIGLKYTGGDKEVITQAYGKAEDMSFCKRRWYYNEYIEQWLAPLSLASIDKSLYMHRKGPESPLQISIQQVDAALREYARHDEETFETRREMLRSACCEIGIDHCVRRLSLSYWDWLDIINQKYFLEELTDDDDELNVFEI